MATVAPVAKEMFVSVNVAFEKFSLSLGTIQPPFFDMSAALRWARK